MKSKKSPEKLNFHSDIFRVLKTNGDGGIRTHVPVARQLDFESSSL